MTHDHSHAAAGNGNERALWISLGLTGAFMIAEVITGVLSNSLALISDAAHNVHRYGQTRLQPAIQNTEG